MAKGCFIVELLVMRDAAGVHVFYHNLSTGQH